MGGFTATEREAGLSGISGSSRMWENVGKSEKFSQPLCNQVDACTIAPGADCRRPNHRHLPRKAGQRKEGSDLT